MKTITKLSSILFFILFSLNSFSQNSKFKHFEIDLALSFWSPNSSVLQATSTVTNISIPDANYTYTSASHGGFGNSFAPDFKLSYFFKNNFGLSVGFNPVMMTNDMFVQLSDTTSVQYNNYAEIMNITIGFTKRIINTEKLVFSFGGGLNAVADVGIHIETIGTDYQTYLEGQNGNVGLYIDLGLKMQIYKAIYFKTAFKYSRVSIDDFGLHGENIEIRYKELELGGTAIIAGLSFVF